MHIGVQLPPLQTNFYRRPQPRNLIATALASSTDTNRTHLANLSRLLNPQPQQSQSQQFSQNPLSSLRFPSLFLPKTDESGGASPRSLARLRTLLSNSSQYPSPRSPISSRWRSLHGCSDWSGLLHPLDPDLRRELLRYGDFIHSAYRAFFHHSPNADDTRHVLLPDRSYRLTRHLFATSSIKPPPWLPSWTSDSSSWIGFVAVCDNESEIRRMGRRDILITLRGTATFLEWAENLRANLVPLDAASDLKVECGFRNLYTTPGNRLPSLCAAVVDEVKRLVDVYRDEELSVTVTGHSLGAALAVLVANDLSSMSEMPPVTVFSFGGPRVGNRGFADGVEGRGVKVLRVVNKHDLVTMVPAAIGGGGGGWRWWDGYEHVGKELRVDSSLSPFLKPNADPACCHDLEAYLHLVDGLGDGDGCRFKTNAKRSLVRLLSHQPGNVKKLFVSKAKALGLDRSAPEDKPETRSSSGSCLASSSS